MSVNINVQAEASFTCDQCGASELFTDCDRNLKFNTAELAGWRAGGGWCLVDSKSHLCPKCVKVIKVKVLNFWGVELS